MNGNLKRNYCDENDVSANQLAKSKALPRWIYFFTWILKIKNCVVLEWKVTPFLCNLPVVNNKRNKS